MTSRASSRASAPAAAVAAAALIAGCVLASAPSASASASAARSAGLATQTFHCHVRIEAEFLFVRFDMYRNADVVATTAARAESAAQAKVNAGLPINASAISAECTAIA